MTIPQVIRAEPSILRVSCDKVSLCCVDGGLYLDLAFPLNDDGVSGDKI